MQSQYKKVSARIHPNPLELPTVPRRFFLFFVSILCIWMVAGLYCNHPSSIPGITPFNATGLNWVNTIAESNAMVIQWELRDDTSVSFVYICRTEDTCDSLADDCTPIFETDDLTVTEYNDTTVVAGQSYCYGVYTVLTESNETPTIFTQVASILPDTTAPTSITNLETIRYLDKIGFSWENPTDTDFAGIKICRTAGACTAIDTSCTPIHYTLPSDTSYTDETPLMETSYCYSFLPFDNAGNYAESSQIEASTLPPTYEYDISAKDFRIIACNPDTLDASNCSVNDVAYHSMVKINDSGIKGDPNRQDIDDDIFACLYMTLTNEGNAPIELEEGESFEVDFYCSYKADYDSDAVFMGTYVAHGPILIPAEGEYDLHANQNGTDCLPGFYYDRYAYPNSDPAGDGLYVWADIDPDQLQFTEDADPSNHWIPVDSAYKLHTEDGGNDPVWTQTAENDTVYIEVRSPNAVQTDTVIFIFDDNQGIGAMYGPTPDISNLLDSLQTASTFRLPVQSTCTYDPDTIDSCADFTTFTQLGMNSLFLASLYTPYDTSLTTNDTIKKYLPQDNGVTDGTDHVYYIRVQVSPFNDIPASGGCYAIWICSEQHCDWDGLGTVPCSSTDLDNELEASWSTTQEVGGAQLLTMDAVAPYEAQLQDAMDYDWYKIVKP